MRTEKRHRALFGELVCCIRAIEINKQRQSALYIYLSISLYFGCRTCQMYVYDKGSCASS